MSKKIIYTRQDSRGESCISKSKFVAWRVWRHYTAYMQSNLRLNMNIIDRYVTLVPWHRLSNLASKWMSLIGMLHLFHGCAVLRPYTIRVWSTIHLNLNFILYPCSFGVDAYSSHEALEVGCMPRSFRPSVNRAQTVYDVRFTQDAGVCMNKVPKTTCARLQIYCVIS